ncbi:cell division topological specificity factor MinE [unidentified bacterial endosymbiont]|uniref:cell division topological specificity factor MinE n=1 Tax=unidentified bacterial endosymbiont TaxID=2355 RepID=UPI0020A22197|nr:cell division topological specificity factor MinE [unidentified bacterial endosymbiont]
MALLDFFLARKKNSASVAKERLQIIVAQQRRAGQEPPYLPQLKRDLLQVICRYVNIDPDQLTLQLEQKSKDISVLELNITLPDEPKVSE